MKQQFFGITLAAALLLTVTFARADEAAEHEKHHPPKAAKTEATSKDKDGMSGGAMMGGMDMHGMMDMMKECMDTHKDGKMCDKECMKKCQEGKGKKECQNMMAMMKKQEKTVKKSK